MNFHLKLLIVTLALTCANQSFSKTFRSSILKNKTFVIYTPHIFNPKFFSFEIGFLTKKSIKNLNYPFNAFAKVLIGEEFFSTTNEHRAGALGLKLGVFLPTQPWVPLLLELALGYAKTSLHQTPWLGEKDKSLSSKDLVLLEAGGIYTISHSVFLRIVHQVNNLSYFKRKTFFSVGFKL